MLRINIDQGPEAVQLRLEGKLIHPWVDELLRAWMGLAARLPKETSFIIDLNDVSFVDSQGKALLGFLLRSGCRIQGSGPFISAVIEEVRSSRSF